MNLGHPSILPQCSYQIWPSQYAGIVFPVFADTSNATDLHKNQLGNKMSAGRVLMWSLLKLSTLTPPLCALDARSLL